MNEIVIKQSRVCDHLRSCGLGLKKKDDREFFLINYESVPGLKKRTTKHKSAKSEQSCWYVFETGRYLTVPQAEKEIADKFAEHLKLES